MAEAPTGDCKEAQDEGTKDRRPDRNVHQGTASWSLGVTRPSPLLCWVLVTLVCGHWDGGNPGEDVTNHRDPGREGLRRAQEPVNSADP